MGPYQAFKWGPTRALGGLGRSVINFQGAGEQANFFAVSGKRDLKKSIKGSWGNGYFSFRDRKVRSFPG